MSSTDKNQKKIVLKTGQDTVTLYYRRPSPGELIETLVRKMPGKDECDDARRILSANLELGRLCVVGVKGAPELKDFHEKMAGAARDREWKEALTQAHPLLLIALGQHLSALPSFMEEDGLKKS